MAEGRNLKFSAMIDLPLEGFPYVKWCTSVTYGPLNKHKKKLSNFYNFDVSMKSLK